MAESRGSILISTANKIGATLVKKLGGTGYTPSEWADKINLLGALPEDTVSGAIANFPDGAEDVPVVELIASIEPKQAGSGDPAPDNVRPISGFTECKITKIGKNLISNTSFTYGLPNTTIGSSIDTITPSTRYAYIGSSIKGGNYTISAVSNDTDSFNSVLYYGYSNGILAIYGQATINGARTVDFSGCDFIRLAIGSRTATIQVPTDLTNYGTLQIETGSSATDYEPYQAPEIKTISWETEAGIVYGGYLNVTTGELTVTHKIYTFTGNETWTKQTGASKYYTTAPNTGYLVRNAKLPPANTESVPIMTDIGSFNIPYNALQNYPDSICIAADARLCIHESLYSGEGTLQGIKVYYEIANYLTYQLTPEEVKTLLGVNNIYSDTGDVSVKYRADIPLYIEKITQ